MTIHTVPDCGFVSLPIREKVIGGITGRVYYSAVGFKRATKCCIHPGIQRRLHFDKGGRDSGRFLKAGIVELDAQPFRHDTPSAMSPLRIGANPNGGIIAHACAGTQQAFHVVFEEWSAETGNAETKALAYGVSHAACPLNVLAAGA